MEHRGDPRPRHDAAGIQHGGAYANFADGNRATLRAGMLAT
jgi:hypothetical protein